MQIDEHVVYILIYKKYFLLWTDIVCDKMKINVQINVEINVQINVK